MFRLIHIADFRHNSDISRTVCYMYVISADNLAKLQYIQNVAANIFTYHLSPPAQIFCNLHWLPIKHRINFKVAALTYKTIATGQPECLDNNLLNTYQPVCFLCSQDNHLLAKPLVYTSIGHRTFNYAATQIWNAIPLIICNSQSVGSFKSTSKTFYFAAVLIFNSSRYVRNVAKRSI